MKIRYEEMFPDEFKAASVHKPIAYLPLGVMEFHGWHNVLGLDSLKAQRICELAAAKTGGIVLPTLSIGYDLFPWQDASKAKQKVYDCYTIDPDLYQKVLEQYFDDILQLGFKKLIVIAGHYPNKDIALKAAERVKEAGQVIYILKEPDLLNESGDHAGTWETSLMMAMFPDLVDLERAKPGQDRLLAVWGKDPRDSSAEYGQQCLDQIIAGIETLANE